MEQTPRLALRIVLFEMRQESGVREVLQARAVIGHDVHGSWQEEPRVAVAVLALVSAGEVAEVRWGSVTGYGTSRHSREGGSVVRACGEGGVGAVYCVGHESDLAEDAAMLEVAVGKVAVQVVPGDKAPLDVRWKGASPGVAVRIGVKEDPSHAHLGSIGGTQE